MSWSSRCKRIVQLALTDKIVQEGAKPVNADLHSVIFYPKQSPVSIIIDDKSSSSVQEFLSLGNYDLGKNIPELR